MDVTHSLVIAQLKTLIQLYCPSESDASETSENCYEIDMNAQEFSDQY